MEFVIIKTSSAEIINRACARMSVMGMHVTFNGEVFEIPENVEITDTKTAWVFSNYETGKAHIK